jgi:hypothetical protein
MGTFGRDYWGDVVGQHPAREGSGSGAGKFALPADFELPPSGGGGGFWDPIADVIAQLPDEEEDPGEPQGAQAPASGAGGAVSQRMAGTGTPRKRKKKGLSLRLGGGSY